MSKLDNLTFYSKLQDLFDAIPPQEIPGRINEVIQFIIQNKRTSISEINVAEEALEGVKQAFEDSMAGGGTWEFILCNHEKDYQINLKVFYNFLSDNEDFISILDCLTENWHILITDNNIEEFKKIQGIITSLKFTFRESTYASW